MIGKAVPLVLRHHRTEILGFTHPLAGKQLVKGTIEAGEEAHTATQRELFEESGLRLEGFTYLTTSRDIVAGQEWVFFTLDSSGLPEQWMHHCLDDGGHDFRFFWHPLSANAEGWHPVFQHLLRLVKTWVL